MHNNNEQGSVKFDIKIDKVDELRRIVTGAVYSPNRIDGKGMFMSEETVERLCHRFMALGLNKAIDTDHDNIINGSYAVESYISKDGDSYAKGTWVLSVKVDNDEVWDRILKGELNAYSMEIMLIRKPVVVEVVSDPNQIGEVEPNQDGHTHFFYAEIDPSTGRVLGGRTSETNGHYHEIEVNSVTNISNDHSHRFILG